MRNEFLKCCKNFYSYRIALIFIVSCIVGVEFSFAEVLQERTVTGVVTSGTDGEALIGVSVQVKERPQVGTITDFEGRYSLQARSNETIVFSYIGFKSQEVKASKTVVNVELEEDSEILDEVVVVGYGTMKRSDLTGSVVSVGEDEIKQSIVTSLDQALQSKAAGVSVTQNSGTPGGGISVSIRGINSLNGNEPLYVIDGVAISGNNDSNSSVLSSINPSDVVSMEILKDASATAIYGSRASNGVVLITTKQGQAGKTRITYEGYYGLQQLPKKLGVMNLREYAEYQNLRAEVIGFGERAEFADISLLGEGTDWQGEIFQNASMHNHQLNISGGNDNVKYSLSAGYLQQEGIAIGSDFERFSARVNMDNKITKWLSTGLRASVAQTTQNNTIDSGNIIRTAIEQLPDTPARNPDGSWGAQAENMYGTYFSNPVAEALMRENYNRGLQMYVDFFADVTLWKGLVFRAEYAGNYYYSNTYQYTPSYDYGHYVQSSTGSRGANNGSNWTLKTYLTYNGTFGKHNISVMAGHEAQENSYETLYASRDNYLFNTIHELNMGDSSTAKNSSGRGSSAIESYYGRLNYGYDDRYLATFTVRGDGSSSFGPANRWGVFPSMALAWKINNEKFLKNVKWLNNLKLRLGWGLVGNQSASSYAYGVTMASAASIWGTGFYAGNYPNDKLKWEETKAWNAGIDLNLFDNRVEFIFDTYLKNTDNLLMQASLPSYVTGIINSPWVNAGAMENKGAEFTLNTVNISKKDFTWRTGITISFNKNKITKLYTETAGLSGTIDGAQTLTYSTVGQPVGQYYGYKVIGMFKEESDFYQRDADGNFLLDKNGNRLPVALPENQHIAKDEVWVGDYIFEDLNGDGVIDEQDRTYLGNPEPKFSYGFNNTFTYKGFDMNIFINGVYGNKLVNLFRQDFTNPMRNSNLLKEVTGIAHVELIDPAQPEEIWNVHVSNPESATVQRLNTADGNDNNRMSSRFVEDGSYLRIKNISLGYTFPQKWTRKWHIENLRVYMNIQNAFTFTKYKGYDPEVGAYNYNVLLRGVDYARYPSQRIYTVGLNLSF
ncbi:Outer membrane cobalamin receptor protein [uncultured Bacteroides sp.]|uniref:SusC/RagA family TonB-linked outer membrane protein n=1 Tax=Bacteroides cellulolyticus TaxID=2981780 RepID=UPI00082217D2|nr:TonB-dependent receptor [Bacteroides cellulolyticus]MCU6772924.1 TonB-dependent receptor [Bacteroides cellulolyticus]SCI66776.1 Outer membrane cobalamin receptor protein [uncultured Bacteroides sp.]